MSRFGGVPVGGGAAPEDYNENITLEQVNLLKGSFDKNNIRFLQQTLKNQGNGMMLLNDLNEYLLKQRQMSTEEKKIYNTAYLICYLCANYNSEFAENNFPGMFLIEHPHTVYSLGHGNINTVYYSDADISVLSNLYAENLDERIASLKTKDVTIETRPGCTSLHFSKFSGMLETMGKEGRSFSRNQKMILRNFNKTSFEEYKKKLDSQIRILQEQLHNQDAEVDESDFENEIQNIETEKREIQEIMDETQEGKSHMLKTYSTKSLQIFNTQLSNTKEEHPSKVQDNGIIYIPQIDDKFVVNGLEAFCQNYLTIKSQNSDPDSQYYSVMQASVGSIRQIFDTMIGRRNDFQDYAWCIYKRPGARLGSMAYEIVKQYVRQSRSEDMKLLFYTNFGFDNLVYKTSETSDMSLTMRSTNNGEKLVEMLTLLEIMSCCGPHMFMNSSCTTTVVDKDDVDDALNDALILTQDSTYSRTSSQNSGYGYVPYSPPYAPSSPHVQYSQSYVPQDLTLSDLASEEEPKKSKRKQKHGKGRGNKSKGKESRKIQQQNKIYRVHNQGKTVNKSKQPKKGGSRNYRRQKRKYTAKLQYSH